MERKKEKGKGGREKGRRGKARSFPRFRVVAPQAPLLPFAFSLTRATLARGARCLRNLTTAVKNKEGSMSTFRFNSTITGGSLSILNGTMTITSPPVPPTMTYTLTNGTVCPVSNISIGSNSASFQITYNGNLYTFSGNKSGSNYTGSVSGPSITAETDDWTATARGTEEEVAAKKAGA
jgi:hypothetical protein